MQTQVTPKFPKAFQCVSIPLDSFDTIRYISILFDTFPNFLRYISTHSFDTFSIRFRYSSILFRYDFDTSIETPPTKVIKKKASIRFDTFRYISSILFRYVFDILRYFFDTFSILVSKCIEMYRNVSKVVSVLFFVCFVFYELKKRSRPIQNKPTQHISKTAQHSKAK